MTPATEAPAPGMGKRGRWKRKLAMLEAQEWRCAYCDAAVTLTQGPRLATEDHVLATANGGTDEPDNRVIACHQCNRMKGCMTVEQIRRLADRIEQLQAKGAQA